MSLALWLLPVAASGTTFVLMDNAQLMEASDAVVVGTVTAIESTASASGGTIYTYVKVQPDTVIKGAIAPGPIVLREPGGSAAGRTEWLFGAPEFWTGERSLLFLSRDADGSLQTTNLSMGKYAVSIDANGALTAVRNFGYGASVYVPETGQLLEAQPETQPLAPLIERLHTQARAQAAARPRDTLPLHTSVPKVTTPTVTEQHEAFTLLGSPPARWFEPDSGLPVRFLIDENGDAAVGPTGSRAAVHAAMAAWTNVPAAKLVIEDAGSAPPAPWRGCGVSEISFNDPANEISQQHGCAGILAIGGFCTGAGSTVVHGRTFGRIASGKVIFNDGWGSCSFWNECSIAEIATHEIGHAIGFGHSGDSGATMAAYAHFDGRCASLRSDDVAAVTYVYPAVGGPDPSTPVPTATPGGGATATPSGGATPTAAPPSTPAPTRVPTLPTNPTPPPSQRCSGVNKISMIWAAKRPSIAKVLVSATKCPAPAVCDTPFMGEPATAGPVVMTLAAATTGAFSRVIDQPVAHRGGCPGGSDTYSMDGDRLRFVFGAKGLTTVVGKVTVPLTGAMPPSLGLPLSFSMYESTGYAVAVAATTCATRTSTTGVTIKCF